MNFDWQYLIGLANHQAFWEASLLVAWLSCLTWLIGGLLGFFVALARMSQPLILQAPARIYIWFFRSLPLLVLLIFVYNLPQLIPSLRPILSNPFWAGLIALVISETAYLAEIHRGGLLSVERGQHEAAHALGIRPTGKYRHVIVPQAVRVALPALGNQFITIVKLTSLVSVISLAEVLLVGQRLYTRNFLVIETLVAVSCYYVLIVTVFTTLLGRLEQTLDLQKKTPGEIPLDPSIQIPQLSLPVVGAVPNTVLKLSGVSKSFGTKTVLNEVDLEVRQGEVVSIIGPSGSGKTTLIRTINALQDIDSGTIEFNGQPWISARPNYQLATSFNSRVIRLGMVFQNFNLFPHLTVLENVTLAPRYHQMGSKSDLEQLALGQLARVGMAVHAHKYPHQLSGGQKQRVAIARALAMQPEVMLFDEPTSALDPELVGEVLQTIERLAQEGMTMVVVTHEMRFATRISQRIVMMEQGKVAANVTRDELLALEPTDRIRQFMAHAQEGA